MSTAEKAAKTAGHGAAWANLVVCGGISWAVSLWHATHPEQGTHPDQGTHPNMFLAILAATAPVVTAAFASHNVANKDAGTTRQVLTCIVFIMGMALSVKAQAQSIGPIVGGTALGVVFALMLDVSTFISLSLIMANKPAADESERAPAGAPVTPPVRAPVRPPVAPPVGAPAAPPADRLPAPKQAPALPPAQAPAKPPADHPKKTQSAPAPKAQKAKLTPEQVKAKAWELLKENPEMSAPELARELGKSPTSGHVRDMKRALLEEMRDAGDLPSVRAIGA